MDVGNLISGSSAFLKSSLNIWKFSVLVLLKPSLENFEHYFASVKWVQLWSSLKILWHCLFWDWNGNWPLQSCGHYWVFQICWQLYCCLSHLHITQSESEVTQSCPTLCDPMDSSLPGFSIHGIFQARVLEWVSISFSRGSSQPRDRTQVSCIAADALPPEPPGKRITQPQFNGHLYFDYSI